MNQRKHIVKWIIDGQMIIDGKAHSRTFGDEDIVSRIEMISMTKCGQVVDVGLIGDISAKRLLKGKEKQK